MTVPSPSSQQIGLAGAVAIGLASMLGAGVFVVFRDAYRISQSGLLVAIGLAALVASLNAWSVYSLARKVDRPGGVYSYARIYLSDSASFAAGFAFVFGKIGSIAAIALAFNEYLAPQFRPWPALAAIAGLAFINILGIQRTALVAGVLAALTTTFLTVVAVAGMVTPSLLVQEQPALELDVFGVLQAASVIFFAFAGYARVATLGTEVRDAKRNVPAAIVIALLAVLVLYLALGIALTSHLGAKLGEATAPLATLASLTLPGLPNFVTGFVATFASLGSMLALLAGVSRTAATMAQDLELPVAFGRRNRFGSPWLAEVLIAALAGVLVLPGQLVWVVGFSSFSVLFYYAIGHVSALRQVKNERVIPRSLAGAGLILSLVLALAVPGPAVPVSVGILVLALVIRSSIKTPGRSRHLGSAGLGVLNEVFHPSAHNVQVVVEQQHEARVPIPKPDDKP